jgi:hypothetical protein
MVADNLSKAGWSWGRDDGKRFIMHADEKLTSFLELEAAVFKSQGKLKRHGHNTDSYTECDRFGVVLSAKRKA